RHRQRKQVEGAAGGGAVHGQGAALGGCPEQGRHLSAGRAGPQGGGRWGDFAPHLQGRRDVLGQRGLVLLGVLPRLGGQRQGVAADRQQGRAQRPGGGLGAQQLAQLAV